MTVRLATLGALAIALAIGGLRMWRSREPRELQRIAARLIPCPADQIEVVASDASDTAEVHHLRGCGMETTMICSAPDFACGLVSTP